MTEDSFRLRVIDQGFCQPDTGSCPIIEGAIELIIGGARLLGPDNRDIGIGKTALRLARTLTEDHLAQGMESYLVMHACGLGSQPGCENGLDWDVRYAGGMVKVSNVQENWSTSPRVDRSGLSATMSATVYQAEVAAFCLEVLAFAEAHPRDHEGDALYEEDWRVWQEVVRDRLAGGTTRFPLVPRRLP